MEDAVERQRDSSGHAPMAKVGDVSGEEGCRSFAVDMCELVWFNYRVTWWTLMSDREG